MSLQALGMFVKSQKGARDLTEGACPGFVAEHRDFDWNQFAAAFYGSANVCCGAPVLKLVRAPLRPVEAWAVEHAEKHGLEGLDVGEPRKLAKLLAGRHC